MDLVKNLETEYQPMLEQKLFEQEPVYPNNLAKYSEFCVLNSLQEYITGIIACLDPECNFTSTNAQIVLNHLRDQHAYVDDKMQEVAYSHMHNIYGNQKYLCSFCSNEYITFFFLRCHLEYVHSHLLKRAKEADTQPCTSTNIVEPTVIPPWTFGVTRSKNTKIKDQVCTYCNKEFTGKDLLLHMKRKHIRPEEQELFFCGINGCDNAYTTKPSLAVHITRSHKEKVFFCEQCNKAYALPGDLKRHKTHAHKKPHRN